jgi:transposase
MKFILTSGEQADCLQAQPLLQGESAKAVLADKGYDADYIVAVIATMGAEAVIPSKSNRKASRGYDEFLYKERNAIERMFGKMKHFRGIATRYNKLTVSFMAFLQLAAIILWLK